MKIDIYLKEKSGNREIRFPILPETISFQTGETVTASYDIMGRGPVAIPTGTELMGFSWESLFPGENNRTDPRRRGSWKAPKNYHNTLVDWKENGTTLHLLVTGYPINKDVYIADYTAKAEGAFGDIFYELILEERREITIVSSVLEKASTTKRTTTETTSYTIKSGDTLWGISQRFLGAGTKWRTIYDANKAIIESTAKKHGYKNSDTGWWIFPGCVITIPK